MCGQAGEPVSQGNSCLLRKLSHENFEGKKHKRVCTFIYVNFKNGQSIFLMIEMSTEIVSENGKIDQKGIQDNFVECIEIVLCLCLYLSKLTELYT